MSRKFTFPIFFEIKMNNFCPCPDHSENELDPLEIYLSPIEINIDPIKDRNKFFLTNHTLIFPQESIEYVFNNDQNINKREWKVLNPHFTIENNFTNYRLDSFHIHDRGEHIINGVIYDLELHFVFLENLQSIHDTCSNEIVENILVYAVLFKLDCCSDKLASDLRCGNPIVFPNSKICCSDRIINSHFVTYSGSLTKPVGEVIYEVSVNWNISTAIGSINKNDLDYFRSLCSRESSDTKPLNGRNINVIGCGRHC